MTSDEPEAALLQGRALRAGRTSTIQLKTLTINPSDPLGAQRAALLYFFMLPTPGLGKKAVAANPSVELVYQA